VFHLVDGVVRHWHSLASMSKVVKGSAAGRTVLQTASDKVVMYGWEVIEGSSRALRLFALYWSAYWLRSQDTSDGQFEGERRGIIICALDGVSTGVDEAARCFDDLLRQ
jgi:hypothetical protein